MSSTTQVIDFSDIFTEILNKMRQPTGITAVTNQAKRYANTAMHDIALGMEYHLPWLERDAVLITIAPYTAGTVAITRGSTTVTGTSTLWTTANVYGVNNARTIGKMTFGDSNVYRITTVGGAGSITLASRYVAGADLAAGAAYSYFEDEYALASDFLRPIDYRMFSSAISLSLVGRNEFKLKFPRPNVAGKPKVATLLDKVFGSSTTPVTYIQFYPYPNDNYIIPYSYITNNLAVSSAGVEATSMSADADEPNMPLRYRNTIVLSAIASWYRDKKDDARATQAMAEYHDLLTRLVGDVRIGTNTTAQVQPRVGQYTGYARSPYGGVAKGRRFSTNNSFDTFND